MRFINTKFFSTYSFGNKRYGRNVFNKPTSKFKGVLLAGAALLSWYLPYIYFTNKIDEDCSLIRQVMFNLERDGRLNQILGENYSIESGSIKGEMGMIRGHADITFKLKGSDEATVHVISRRKPNAGSWTTELLEVTPIMHDDAATRDIDAKLVIIPQSK